MTFEERRELTPQEFIARLFAETEDGKVSIQYHPFLDEPYTMTYDMSWTEKDARALAERYNSLTEGLERLAGCLENLEDLGDREKLLRPEDLEIWKTYLAPFEPSGLDEDEISTLYIRRETETLSDEEYEMIERHFEWFLRGSLQRLPFEKCPPAFVINRACRYARLIQLKAPSLVVQSEGRDLAEEMILYYYGPERFEEYKA